MVIVQVSHKRELFESIDFYSRDGLEIAGHSMVTLGREALWLLLQLPWT